MKALINIAVELLFESWVVKFKEMIISATTNLISFIETSLISFYTEPLISETLNFGRWLAYAVFAGAIAVLLVDIAEEAGSLKSEQFKVIEWPTILMNLVKAIAFIEGASRMGIIAMQLCVQATSTLDPKGYLTSGISFSNAFWGFWMPIITLIAIIGFILVSIMRIGAMFIQSVTVFLYVADIVRGQTTAMGDWLRQSIAIVVTYFLQHILFIQGLIFYANGNYISTCVLWVTMFGTSKLLNKYGMSTGITGILSSASGAAQGAVRTIGSMIA